MTSLPNPIPLDIALFRAQFPVFVSDTKFPDALIDMKWDEATTYISDCNYGRLHDKARRNALNYMTAHLMYLDMKMNAQAANAGKIKGARGGVVTAATIDKVSVTLLPPPVTEAWDWWLLQSPFGTQLLALLQANSVGGFSVGGLPEGDAFRKVYGAYGPGRNGGGYGPT